MIFVTVGTHEQQFNRLISCVDALKKNGTITEDVIMQTGYSTYEPQCCKWQKMLPYQEMVSLTEQARIVITHGGPSSFVIPLHMGKVPVVVPRMVQYHEHVNDHQLRFCRMVAERIGGILVVEDVSRLGQILTDYDSLAHGLQSGFASNNASFNRQFSKIVEELLNGEGGNGLSD